MRLLHLHGRRLREEPRPRRRADPSLRAAPLCLGDDDEPPGRGSSPPRPTSAPQTSMAVRRVSRHQPARARRQDPRPLRPDRQPPAFAPRAGGLGGLCMSVCAATASSRSDRSPPAAPRVDEVASRFFVRHAGFAHAGDESGFHQRCEPWGPRNMRQPSSGRCSTIDCRRTACALSRASCVASFNP